ncbi:hypothetical protein HN51_051930, partial [Arachis hypogaea]
PSKRKNPEAVKISPWTLAQLNAKEVSKAATEARKRSEILFGSRGRQVPRIDNKRRTASKQGFLPADIAMASMTKGPDVHSSFIKFEKPIIPHPLFVEWDLNILKKPIVTYEWLKQCSEEHRVVPQESYKGNDERDLQLPLCKQKAALPNTRYKRWSLLEGPAVCPEG